MKHVGVIILLSITQTLFAQAINRDALIWTVERVTNTVNADVIVLQSAFETGPASIKWIQKNGSIVYLFDILETHGEWKDIKNFGEIDFNVKFRDSTGSIKCSYNQDGYFIEIKVLKEGQNLFPYIFHINQVALKDN